MKKCYYSKFAFTLLEVIISLFISSLIVLGSYRVFNTLISTRLFLEDRKTRAEKIAKIVSLIQKDIRCKVGGFDVQSNEQGKILVFYTTNSLFFSGAFPVKVLYFLENDGKENIFYREEISEDTDFVLKIPLTNIFTSIDFLFYNYGTWSENNLTNIVKVILKTKDKTYSFVEKGIIG